MKYTFPALIEEDKNDPGFYIITFPDLIGIGSECEAGEEMEVAKEILSLALSSKHRRLVEPTDVEVLKKHYPNCEVILVEVDIEED